MHQYQYFFVVAVMFKCFKLHVDIHNRTSPLTSLL